MEVTTTTYNYDTAILMKTKYPKIGLLTLQRDSIK